MQRTINELYRVRNVGYVVGVFIMLCGCVMRLSASEFRADSLEFYEFAKKISHEFDEKKINSIISKLPSKFKIFGYDVGDIDADSTRDLVLSARDAEDKRKTMEIYFFMNRADSFWLAKTIRTKYYAMPIEIAFSIENGVCYLTRKIGEYHWEVTGYVVRNMIFRAIDRWETQRLNYHNSLYNIGYDVQDDFEKLTSREHFYRTTDNKTYLKSSGQSLPVYSRDQRIPSFFPRSVICNTPSHIIAGSSSWSGEDDASFSLRANYDSMNVRFEISITDDSFLPSTEKESGDVLSLWFDLSGKKKVDATYNNYIVRDDDAAEVLGVDLLFEQESQRHKATIRFQSERLTKSQQPLLKNIRSETNVETNGVLLCTLILPKRLFSKTEKGENVFSFTAAYRDVDWKEHNDWITIAATSENFQPGNPKTFGLLRFISDGEYYGDVEDLSIPFVLQKMKEAGLM